MHNFGLASIGFTALFLVLAGCSSFTKGVDGKLVDIGNKTVNSAVSAESVDNFQYFSEISELNLGRFEWGGEYFDRPPQLDAKLTYRYEKTFPVITALNIISADVGVHIALDDKAFTYLKGDDTKAGSGVSNPSRSIGYDSTITYGDGVVSTDAPINNDIVAPASSPRRSSLRNMLTHEERGDTVVMNMRNVSLEEWLDEFTLKRSLFWDWSYIDGKPFITISATVETSFVFEGTTNTTTVDDITLAESKTWAELEDYVKASLSDIGTATFSPSSGRIRVNDRPNAVSNIGKRIKDENTLYNKEILFNVQFISYSNEQSDTFSSDVTSLFDALGESLTFNSTATTASGFNLSNDETSDTNATLRALNTITKTAQIKKVVGKVKNRTPFYRKILGKESIVETLSLITDADTGDTSLDPNIDTVETGISVNVVGTLISNGEIALELSITRDDEIGRETVDFVETSITLPNSRKDTTLLNFNLKDGESIIIPDSDIFTSSSQNRLSGDLGWINYIFGGSKTAKDKSTITLLVITATIVGND